jgi:hypothetical protein
MCISVSLSVTCVQNGTKMRIFFPPISANMFECWSAKAMLEAVIGHFGAWTAKCDTLTVAGDAEVGGGEGATMRVNLIAERPD